MSLSITSDVDVLTEKDVISFFASRPQPPSAGRILAAIRGASEVSLAWEGERLIGFATAVSDGALFAYVPMVEVVSDRRGEGIGTALVRFLVGRFEDLYGVDLCCDDDVVPFYERLGFSRVNGMVLRRPEALR